MDKETLSNYGWIVITVVIIALMIGIAAALGDEITTAIEGAVKALADKMPSKF